MSFYIKGDTRPVLGKNVYTLMSTIDPHVKKKIELYIDPNANNTPKVDLSRIVKQRWELLKKGKQILDLGNDGGVTFNQSSLGIEYTIKVFFTDAFGISSSTTLDLIPIAGKPSIQNLKWQDEYYEDLNGRAIAYLDNVRLYIHTLNIPVGDTLEVTIWEDEGLDGHDKKSRNMGTCKTTRVDRYGKSELFFNNLKLYQKILNDKDYINEDMHEFYAEVKYKGKIDVIEDKIQLKVFNNLVKRVERPKSNSPMVVHIPDKLKKPENKKGVKVNINVFFDGTLNNSNNTDARLVYEKKKKGLPLTPKETKAAEAYKKNKENGSSYDNYYSNIAILHQMNIADNKNKEIKIYLEGEGTEDYQVDDTDGYAFGSGKTGIPAKVNKAFVKIKNDIEKLTEKKIITEKEFIKEIELTVFGFSRGAAAARHFIALKYKIQDKYDIESSNFSVKFAGLFDTVSSYHDAHSLVTGAVNKDFENDVDELKLKMEGVKKVFHLTAADEYRENFSLTTIEHSIAAGVGYELEIPGAHSDVGGGYGEIENETRYFRDEPDFKNIQKVLLEQGWYTPEQLNYPMKSEQAGKPYGGTRTGIPNSYQYIGLVIMVKMAEKHGLNFDKTLIEGSKDAIYRVPDDLVFAKENLINYALKNDGAHSLKATIREEHLKPIRNKYLHRSTSNALGKGGRYKDGKPYRKPIKG
ncbi:putative alpha/beta hydrolase family protein DUF2235 [Flavobacterium sp. 270]|uniref:phospholipase effector Tle1 domain-containing protein n=1 Tax=Flavobacterium sp. 270 TaxID=2512114 RepID=UPI001064DDBC|nr:DUF2235 domain-containing protein [Flavobacterium sp. 270]TDW44267.1 putative alpha/beta hydrolase family protein DUF2235 [Flavobacterium sp. 270]